MVVNDQLEMRDVIILMEVLAFSRSFSCTLCAFERNCQPMLCKEQAESAKFSGGSNPNPALHDQIPKSFLPVQDFDHTALLHNCYNDQCLSSLHTLLIQTTQNKLTGLYTVTYNHFKMSIKTMNGTVHQKSIRMLQAVKIPCNFSGSSEA